MTNITKIYFDTEFTQLVQNTTLISIGLIADNGVTFYGEIKDYNKDLVDGWIKKNVIDNLLFNGQDDFVRTDDDITNVEIKGDKKTVGAWLNKWLMQFNKVEWVADCSSYDFVLLVDLVYKEAMNMPYGKHCAACHDINQDIAEYFKINEIKAFDMSREDILKIFNAKVEGTKHNSLYDAKVVKAIYEGMINIENQN